MNKLLFLLWVFSPIGIYSIGRKQQAPCDESNRFNKLILLWFVFTRYEQTIKFNWLELSQWELVKLATFNEREFVGAFSWLKNDMWERLNK